MNGNPQTFVSDVQELRRRAREHIDQGAVTQNYEGNVHQTIDILQNVLATEIVCVLRYTMHAVAATGGDQAASFQIGTEKAELNIQDWSGFIGQWDTRIWNNESPIKSAK